MAKMCQFCGKPVESGKFHLCKPEDIKDTVDGSIADAVSSLEKSKFSDIVKNAQGSALATMNMSSIINAIPSTKDLFKSSPRQLPDIALNSTTNEYIKNIQASSENYTDFAEGLGSPTNSNAEGTTTFITNTSRESVIPFELPGISGPFDIGSMGGDLLGRIGDMSGLGNITNGSQLTKALGNISNNFSDLMNTATSFVGNMTELPNTLLGGVTDAVNSAVGGFSFGGLMDSVSNFIPDSVKNIVSSVTDVASNVANSITGVISQIPGLGGVADALNDVLNLSNGTYKNITDLSGVQWNGIADNSKYSLKDLNQLHNSAQIICPDIPNLKDLVDFANLKNLYDTLISMATDNGLTNMLDSLLNCGQGMYSDVRTYDVLSSKIDSTARRGDLNTLEIIADTVGIGRFSNPTQTIRTVASNMLNNDSDSWEKLRQLSETLNVDPETILQTEFGSYSAPTIFAMSQDSTIVVDELGAKVPEIRKTALAVLDLYGNKKPTDRSYMGI